jgi:hypothetical protein
MNIWIKKKLLEGWRRHRLALSILATLKPILLLGFRRDPVAEG